MAKTTTASMTGTPPAASPQLALSNAMRRLWTDHVVWTRLYIIHATAGHAGPSAAAINVPTVTKAQGGPPAAAAGLSPAIAGDADAASARLLRNQEEIGSAMAGFYGAEAGTKLTALLKAHILTAAELVKAAKAGNKSEFARQDAAWAANADAIAAFLAAANPHWPAKDLKDLLHLHLELTKMEVTARLEKRWDADVEAFDDIRTEILNLADALSAGIMKQFPQKFAATTA